MLRFKKYNHKLLRIFFIISFVVVFISTLFYIGYKNSGLILAQIISRTTHTPVTINTLDFHQEASIIQNLIIGNPDKAYTPTAFKAEIVKINSPYKQYFKNPIVIDKIEMNNVYINIEFYTEDNIEGNWQVLIDNMEANHKLSSESKRQVSIKKLVLNDVQITLVLSDGKIHRLSPIPCLEFDDVKSEKGIPIEELSEIIARKMMYSIFREDGLNLIIKIPLNVIKKLLPFL